MYDCSKECSVCNQLRFDVNTLKQQLKTGERHLRSQIYTQARLEVKEIFETLRYVSPREADRIAKRVNNILSIISGGNADV